MSQLQNIPNQRCGRAGTKTSNMVENPRKKRLNPAVKYLLLMMTAVYILQIFCVFLMWTHDLWLYYGSVKVYGTRGPMLMYGSNLHVDFRCWIPWFNSSFLLSSWPPSDKNMRIGIVVLWKTTVVYKNMFCKVILSESHVSSQHKILQLQYAYITIESKLFGLRFLYKALTIWNKQCESSLKKLKIYCTWD